MEEKKKRERTKIKVLIENKKTDGATIRQKEEMWQKIVNMYNDNPQVEKREINHLKRLYDNLKRTSKKKYASKKQSRLLMNGQNPIKEAMSDNIDEKIFSIIQPQVEPLNNIYDTDKKFEEDCQYSQKSDLSNFDKEIESNSSAVEVHPDYIYFVSDDPESKPSASATSNVGKELLVLKDSVSTPSTSDCEKTSWMTRNTPATRRCKKTAVVDARENIATLASSRSLLVEMEKSLLIKRHEEEMKLIALKIENEKKKSAVLDAKLLYYKNKK